MVVPGGVFHEVTGDISVFAPEDDALVREMEYFAAVFDVTVDEVRVDKPLLQEILRQFLAYGDVRRDEGFLGLFVTLDGSVWNWTDATPNDGTSEIALVPVGLQLEEPPVVFEVDDAAGTRASGAAVAAGSAASSAITRAGARRSAGWTAGTPRRTTAYREGGVTDDE